MAYADFIIRYDPEKDTLLDVGDRIIYALFIKRLINKKPVIAGIFADSGEGKSYGSIAFLDTFFRLQGVDYKDCFDVCNIVTPLDYAEKVDAILYNKDFKHVNGLAMHEAREIIKAKDWRDFVAQATADVNAQSRGIKPMATFIISQFIKDITREMRYTLNYYIEMRRPRGKPARAKIYKVWKDARDLERPKLRKRKVRGYLVYPDGTRQRYMPEYIEITHPRKELTERFDALDRMKKGLILRRKLMKMTKILKDRIGDYGEKVDEMVEWYIDNPASIQHIGKRHGDSFRLHSAFKKMHEMSPQEADIFEAKLLDKMKDKGMAHEKKD